MGRGSVVLFELDGLFQVDREIFFNFVRKLSNQFKKGPMGHKNMHKLVVTKIFIERNSCR